MRKLLTSITLVLCLTGQGFAESLRDEIVSFVSCNL